MEKQVPHEILKYLNIRNELASISSRRSVLNEEMKQLVPRIKDFLKTRPQFEMPIRPESERDAQLFGDSGKLKLNARRGKLQQLTKDSLRSALFSYERQVNPHVPEEQSRREAADRTEFVWASRVSSAETVVVQRTFDRVGRKGRKKRKTTTGGAVDSMPMPSEPNDSRRPTSTARVQQQQ